MKNNNLEFECLYNSELKKVFIKDISIYNGVTFEHDSEWNKDRFVIKLYFFKLLKEDGRLYVERDYDFFYFDNESKALELYDIISNLLKEV